MSERDGGPAFPTIWRNTGDMNASAPNGEVVPPGREVILPGLSMRDYFAAHAPLPPEHWHEMGPMGRPVTSDDYADWAYRYADAMLAARGKQ